MAKKQSSFSDLLSLMGSGTAQKSQELPRKRPAPAPASSSPPTKRPRTTAKSAPKAKDSPKVDARPQTVPTVVPLCDISDAERALVMAEVLFLLGQCAEPPASPDAPLSSLESNESTLFSEAEALLGEVVTDVERSRSVVEHLLHCAVIAIDCEWSTPSEGVRNEKLCLIQIADIDKRVFLFDLIDAKGDLMGDGRLAALLAAERVLKITHDCRQDSDILQRYGAHLGPVWDSQIAFAVYHRQERGGMRTPLPCGLATVLRLSGQVHTHKKEGRELFENDTSAWERRPMSETLRAYAVDDVRLLPAAYRHLSNLLGHRSVQNVLEWSQQYANQIRSLSDYELKEMREAEASKREDSLRPVPRYRIKALDLCIDLTMKLT